MIDPALKVAILIPALAKGVIFTFLVRTVNIQIGTATIVIGILETNEENQTEVAVEHLIYTSVTLITAVVIKTITKMIPNREKILVLDHEAYVAQFSATHLDQF